MAMGQNTLLHADALFVIFTTDPDNIILLSFTQSIRVNFCGHMVLIKSTTFTFIVHFTEFLAFSSWERDMFSFILKHLTLLSTMKSQIYVFNNTCTVTVIFVLKISKVADSMPTLKELTYFAFEI